MVDRRHTHCRWTVRLTAIIAAFIGSMAACGSEAENSPASPSTSSAIVKIMPLGDSITESIKGQNSYRYYLWHLLLNGGYHVDFVGSRNGVGNGPPANPDFDMDHEGHAGWKADEILSEIQAWATAASPDVVLLHIGTNDVCKKESVGSTVTEIGGIIDTLRTVNPHIRVLMAQLINSSNCPPAALNARLPALVADKDRPESPIVLVDEYTGFDPPTMTYDGTHPNADGDSRMAERWFEKLAPMLDAFSAESHPQADEKLTPL